MEELKDPKLKSALHWWSRNIFNGSLEQQSIGKKYFPNGFDDFESNVLYMYNNEMNKSTDEKNRLNDVVDNSNYNATIYKHISGKYLAKQFNFNTYILVVNDDVLMNSVGFIPREIVTNTNDWKQL